MIKMWLIYILLVIIGDILIASDYMSVGGAFLIVAGYCMGYKANE